MKCFKILLLVSLIPLVLRGVSLLGNVIPAASPEQPSSSSSSSDNGGSVLSRGHLSGGFTQRRFGGDFRDDKRFSPTGSNPLHNL
ncbi:hypothetical protein BDA96_09G064900 [Sorghum bicolor]|uniref:Uncharacterized protein n=2 Tax=Sorghum bicolor TaxID=4558 RepID=C5Z139_SORBI|nr:hypothetical protein SORBI_3009G061700 [Sorghum bicolor]KAG0517167.1 hypothetical protein BDA96_09G064900 [Sorghum bicolor]